jgi:hypothetical protein
MPPVATMRRKVRGNSDGCVFVRSAVSLRIPSWPSNDAVLHVSAPVSVTSTLATRRRHATPGKETLVVFFYAGLAPED